MICLVNYNPRNHFWGGGIQYVFGDLKGYFFRRKLTYWEIPNLVFLSHDSEILSYEKMKIK